MALSTSSPWFFGGFALLALCVGALLALRLRRRFEALTSSRRARRGLKGERVAEKLLKRRGFHVLDRQVAASYEALVDGEVKTVSLTADLLVARAGRRWVAEVKTGPDAPRFEHSDTRRQLLEYQLAFGGDAILLVDPERESIREVRFPLHPSRSGGRMATFLIGAALSGLSAWWLAKDSFP